VNNIQKILLNNDPDEFARHCEINEDTEKVVALLRNRKYEVVEFPYSKTVKEKDGLYYINTRLRFKYIGYINNSMNNVEGDIGSEIIVRMENEGFKIVKINLGGDFGSFMKTFKKVFLLVLVFISLAIIITFILCIKAKK
jgi:hypothetical protein